MSAPRPHTDASSTNTLLITLTGPDRPGVTAAMFETLGQHGVEVMDIEQIVLRGRIILGVLVQSPQSGRARDIRARDSRALEAAVQATAARLGMTAMVEAGLGDNLSRATGRSLVTVIGAPLRAAEMAIIMGRVADTGANIDRIERMARYPVTAIQMHVSGTDPLMLRMMLAATAADLPCDVAVQRADLSQRGSKLLVMDVDSTFITGEVIEMVAKRAGVEREVAEITERAMRGELDFEESFRARIALLRGLPASVLDEVYDEITLTPGARTLVRSLRRLGYRFALVSGGFAQIVRRLADDLGIHFSRSNELEIVDGLLTGDVVGPVLDRAGKAAALREFAAAIGIPLRATVAIGDGANDLDMLSAAGLGVAYNAKPIVAKAADTSVTVPFLDPIIYLLGVTREEIEAADAEEGVVTPAPRLG
ncbi:MAG: phosphoserine phosphatase SerB [Nocardioides sp.]